MILAEAATDIEQAWAFYDAQETGMGDYFADAAVSDIASLVLYHGIHTRYLGFYRMFMHRFSFGTDYPDLDAETQVFAILDLRPDPSWIRTELSLRK